MKKALIAMSGGVDSSLAAKLTIDNGFDCIGCKVKIRYRRPEQWAVVVPKPDKTVQIIFDEPQRAITPGQAAVLYDGDVILGGGTISKTV